MAYYFTSESVSEGHPDKVADQISDAVLDEFLRQDPQSRVACETLVTTGLAMLAGEVRSNAYVDLQKVVRETIQKIGYTKADYRFDCDSCGVISAIHEQSSDIAMGVDSNDEGKDIGAGDQGMMFGYATNETENYMPLSIYLAHKLLIELADLRRSGDLIPYLRPDSKSQVTIEYSDDHLPIGINAIVLSTQHDPFDSDDKKMLAKIGEDIKGILIPRVKEQCSPDIQKLFDSIKNYHINPTGKFVIGGPHGDAGLTGRKIIVDTYGGKGAHGGGAFSGKDSTKVDRSAAYATRHIARNLVAAGVSEKCLVQVAYAIGVSQPVGLFVDTYGTSNLGLSDSEIAKNVLDLFDLRPSAIINNYQLNKPIFTETAAYGHMGRTPGTKKVSLGPNGNEKEEEVETFTWEKEDRIDDIRTHFKL
ncbi:methionine adenosyltransferase [Membranihabitans maritimus]|uniref:methionine adenosyltransferase n=1 Tax=Membranihabitans maritimus TaxID=2904244 RepID=UPI001F02E77D|nr:methionine adenosyltransferase [Membranihabitans maritimus]